MRSFLETLDNTALPLVLIGGTLCNARLWQPVINRLNAASVICISLTGAASAELASRRLLNSLPPRFLLVGFSLGAIVALQIVADASERVAGLTLLSVNPLTDAPENANSRHNAVLSAQKEGLSSWLSASLWTKYVAPARRHDRALHDVICLMAEESGTEAFAAQTEIAIHRQDNRAALAALSCPVLIINGLHDPICTPHHHHLAAESAVQARSVTVESAGHFLVLEAPDEVAFTLRQWIQECLHAKE